MCFSTETFSNKCTNINTLLLLFHHLIRGTNICFPIFTDLFLTNHKRLYINIDFIHIYIYCHQISCWYFQYFSFQYAIYINLRQSSYMTVMPGDQNKWIAYIRYSVSPLHFLHPCEKATTCNSFVYGEYGKYHPSVVLLWMYYVICIDCFLYIQRLNGLIYSLLIERIVTDSWHG